jgi:hypothetical protein
MSVLLNRKNMVFHESVTIDAPPGQVWEYVGSPEMWSLFYLHFSACQLDGGQAGQVGSTYSAMLQLGDKTQNARLQIVAMQPERMIETRSTMNHNGRDSFVTICFSLDDRGKQTTVRLRVDEDFSQLNFLLRALIWLINRFGQPSGESTLEKLKQAVEK